MLSPLAGKALRNEQGGCDTVGFEVQKGFWCRRAWNRGGFGMWQSLGCSRFWYAGGFGMWETLGCWRPWDAEIPWDFRASFRVQGICPHSACSITFLLICCTLQKALQAHPGSAQRFSLQRGHAGALPPRRWRGMGDGSVLQQGAKKEPAYFPRVTY